MKGSESISKYRIYFPQTADVDTFMITFYWLGVLNIRSLSWRRRPNVPKNIEMLKCLPICRVIELAPI